MEIGLIDTPAFRPRVTTEKRSSKSPAASGGSAGLQAGLPQAGQP